MVLKDGSSLATVLVDDFGGMFVDGPLSIGRNTRSDRDAVE
jgi:hypothetical protein